jgi:hypothetical protein
MAVTLTATLAASQPARAVHAGVNSVSGNYNSGASTLSDSPSGMVLLCRVPVGATIVDVVENHSTGANGGYGLSMGIRDRGGSVTYAALLSDVAQATANRAGVTMPYDVGDASSGTSNSYKYVVASKSSGTETTSLKINYTILYTMDK